MVLRGELVSGLGLNIDNDHDQLISKFLLKPINDGRRSGAGQSILRLQLEQHRLSNPNLGINLGAAGSSTGGWSE